MMNPWVMLRVAAERRGDLIAQACRVCCATLSGRWLPARINPSAAMARACVGSFC